MLVLPMVLGFAGCLAVLSGGGDGALANADTSPRPAELVYLLAEQGLAPGLASTVIWEMISSGEIAISEGVDQES